MKTPVMTFALATAFALALPLAAQAHSDTDCNMNGADMSKMSDADREKMMAQCHMHDATRTEGSVPATPATPAKPAEPHMQNGG